MNIFGETYHVYIELSNLCNYAYMHKGCLASRQTEKRILPADKVYNIIDTLAKYKYGKGKSLSFYNYSETLNDPRLFKFIEYARKKLPDCDLIVGTNGWYLNDVMAMELYDVGVDLILVTSYTSNEHIRLVKIKNYVAEQFKRGNLKAFMIRRVKQMDCRLNMTGKKGACYAPLTELILSSSGDLRLCCIDVRQDGEYGNIHKKDFEQIMIDVYPKFYDLRQQLIKSDRQLEICEKCSFVNRLQKSFTLKGDFRIGSGQAGIYREGKK